MTASPCAVATELCAMAAALEASAQGASPDHPAIKRAALLREKAALHQEAAERMSNV